MRIPRAQAIVMILVLLLLVSLLLGAGAVFTALRYSLSRGQDRFAVLSVADTVPEKEVLDLLSQAGVRRVVSESDQWVYIDGFDALERLPLTQYPRRLAPFDLRNDPYASQLVNAFVSGGVRRVFIPVETQPFFMTEEALRARLLAAVDGLTPAVQLFGGGRSLAVPYLVLFSAAALLLFLLAGAWRITALALPALGALAATGSAGFLLTALLYATHVFFQDQVRDFIRNRLFPRTVSGGGFDWMPIATGIGTGGLGLAVIALGGIPLAIGVGAALAFEALFWTVLWIEAVIGQHRGHHRFLPVALKREPWPLGAGFTAAWPLFLAALAAFGLTMSVDPRSRNESAQLNLQSLGVSVSASGYNRHLQYQRSFSVRALRDAGSSDRVYGHYTVAADGLVDAVYTPAADLVYDDVPMPPLEELLADTGASPRPRGYPWGDLASAGISGLAVISCAKNSLAGKKGKAIMSARSDKRIPV